jgi:hypothetical protein
MQRKKTKKAKNPWTLMRRRSSIRALIRQAKAEGCSGIAIEELGRVVRFNLTDQDTSAKTNSWDEALSKNAKAKKRSS